MDIGVVDIIIVIMLIGIVFRVNSVDRSVRESLATAITSVQGMLQSNIVTLEELKISIINHNKRLERLESAHCKGCPYNE